MTILQKIFAAAEKYGSANSVLDSARRFKNLLSSHPGRMRLTLGKNRFERIEAQSSALRVSAHCVFVKPFAPTIFRPARFWKRGKRADRRRCARGRCFEAIVESRSMGVWGLGVAS